MLTEPKLVDVSQNELTMLNYVIGIHVFHRIVGGVDVRVSVLKSGLKNE
jgi:hypothetical protein